MGSMDDAWRVKPPAGACVHAQSPDGRWRAELRPTGRTETDARRRVRPYYFALIVRCADGAVMADSRRSGVEAWALDDDGLELQLASPGEKDSWVFVDLRTGVCYLENFRGPMSEGRGIEGLEELLGR